MIKSLFILNKKQNNIKILHTLHIFILDDLFFTHFVQ